MDKLRTTIQSKLEEIENLEVSAEIPDDVMERDKTYFTYTLQKEYEGSDFDRNYTYEVYINGFIKRIQNDEENTLEIVDKISFNIETKLKELNIKTSFQDITIDNEIRKIRVDGNVRYNELNNSLY